MSKYNNMKSLSIYDIPPEELARAIEEFAEGSESMKKLLWACYHNRIETAGCHAEINPYLQLIVNDSKTQISRMLDAIQQLNDTQVYITPDGGNPFGGPNWYKGTLSIGLFSTSMKAVDIFLNSLHESVISDRKDPNTKSGVFSQGLDFLEFFEGKDSGLCFRGTHTENDEYKFRIELFKSNKNLNYYTELFKQTEFEIETTQEDIPITAWSITDKDPQVVVERIQKSKDYIFNHYSLEPATEIYPGMWFNEKARVMRRIFGNSPEGQQKMQEWLAQERIKIDLEMLSRTKVPVDSTYDNQGNTGEDKSWETK